MLVTPRVALFITVSVGNLEFNVFSRTRQHSERGKELLFKFLDNCSFPKVKTSSKKKDISFSHIVFFFVIQMLWNDPVPLYPPAGSNNQLPQGTVLLVKDDSVYNAHTDSLCVSMWGLIFRKSHDLYTASYSFPKPHINRSHMPTIVSTI